MSSRFVSGGTIAGDSSGPAPALAPSQPPLAAAAAAAASSISPPPSAKPHTTANPSAPALAKLSATPISPSSAESTAAISTSTRINNAEWEAAQASLAAERKQREESRRRAVEGSGDGENQSSLFEILQANKAAKQAAFEEANRLQNQFRALDDDEIDFLDGVEEQRRAEEERLRSETEARLEAFRRAQRGGDREGVEGEKKEGGDEVPAIGVDEVVEEWSAVGRKRKRDRERERERLVKGVKKRATENATTTTREKESEKVVKPAANPNEVASSTRNNAKSVETKDSSSGTYPPEKAGTVQPTNGGPAKPNLGLVDYGSDDDDDDD